MEALNVIQKISLWVVPAILAITVHETAHGWVAKMLGDRTAEQAGRLTLNPLKHIDPIGTLLVPGVALLLSGFVFGWAKPVPVNWGKLRSPKRDMGIVALAGPGANLILAAIWAVLLHIVLRFGETLGAISVPLGLMSVAGIYFNSVLMVLNLIPLPPLDGGRVLTSLLPARYAVMVARIEPWGIPILLVLLVSNVLVAILGPVLNHVLTGYSLISGMPARQLDYYLNLMLQ